MNKRVKAKMIKDEKQAKILMTCAGASMVASFGWVSGRKLLPASIFIMPAIYFLLAVYYHKTH